jgi:uncharacterized RDD family membrane protein YckC
MASELPKDQPEFQPVLQTYPVAAPTDSANPARETSSDEYPSMPPGSGASRFASDLASPGERLTSGLLDVIAVLILGAFLTSTFGTTNRASGAVMTFNDTSVGMAGFVVFQAVALGYFFITELYLGGSFGKLALGQRVLTVERTKPTPRQLAIRTVFRLIDGIPYFIPNLFGFVTLSNNDLRQRLGDRSANTVVVKSR